MAKGFGIAALVLAIIAIFIPGTVWLYVAWGAALLAATGALAGDRIFAGAVTLLIIVNTLFLSPFTLPLLMKVDVVSIIHVVAVLVPLIAIALNATGTIALSRSGQQ